VIVLTAYGRTGTSPSTYTGRTWFELTQVQNGAR
jgi:hypothetical protein